MWSSCAKVFLIGLMLPISLCAQIEDQFEGAELDTTLWKGDILDFRVESGRLRLDAPEDKGRSILWAEWPEVSGSFQWIIDVEMNFDPSGRNFVNLWFVADDVDLNEANGAYVSIGENGNEDPVTIFQKDGRERFIIAMGEPSRVADDPKLRLDAKVKDGGYLLTVNYADGNQEQIGFNLEDSVPKFFIIECNYTSSRADQFYFDNIYLGPVIVDNQPPMLIDDNLTESSVELIFDEPLSPESVTPSSISFIPQIGIDKIKLASTNSILISTAEPFEPGVVYEITIIDIQDLSENRVDTTFSFVELARAEFGELLINEILFNPIGNESDYVEIVNATEEAISLDEIFIGNREKNEQAAIVFPEKIEAGEYLVFTENKEDLLIRYPANNEAQIYEQGLPTFNNDDGNVAIGRMVNGELMAIDSYDYSEKDHHLLLDDEDGVSLERISLDVSSELKENWTSASSLVGFGTPGLINSATTIPNIEMKIAATNKTFSPNGDGNDDKASFTYQVSDSFIGNATVYDIVGKEVFKIWNNETLPTQGTVYWNGQGESGDLSPEGIYIVVFELFRLDGTRLRHKEEIVLVRR